MNYFFNAVATLFILAFTATAAGDTSAPANGRLAISFPIWALYDMLPGGNFADPDRAMVELKARGFNAIRFDDGAGLYSSTNGVPRGKVSLHPPFGKYTPLIRQASVVSKPFEIDVRENLVTVLELDLVHGRRKNLDHGSGHFNRFIVCTCH